ncbi:MAG: methionine synthase [Rhodospirillaceae bacterium]|nr:methionine synthase [Rhodospirillaceae bacterium]
MTDREYLVELIAGMEEDSAVKLSVELMDAGTPLEDILAACRDAMDIVGKKFEEGEFFIPELILAGEMLEQIGIEVKPRIKDVAGPAKETLGKVLIGTVHGDLHDIGKNIVTFMLDVNGYEVIDLGIDVQPQTFIDAIKENAPQVVGLSGFLTLAFDSMKETVEAIADAGLRDQVKIMIGGGQVDERIRSHTGADSFGLNAMNAVSQCQEWITAAA